MSKLLSVVAVLLVVFSFTSFVDKNAISGEGLIEGYKAPQIILDELDANALHGKKVLVSFWATYDAASRASNSLLAAQLRKLPADVRLVSIDFDENPVIFEETVRLEQLDKSTQFHARKGSSSEMFKTFRLNEGFGNYLLNEEGVIIAKNLDPKRLYELLNAKSRKAF